VTLNTDEAEEYCETLHGLVCEGSVELAPHIDAQLPEGDLVEYAQLESVTYRWAQEDGQRYRHEFTDAVLLVGGDGVLYIVGSFTTEPEGIVNTTPGAE
jgi:phosphoribulokinase